MTADNWYLVVQLIGAGNSSIVQDDHHRVFVFGQNQYSQLDLDNKSDILEAVEQEQWKKKKIIAGGHHNVIVDHFP